MDSNKKRYSTMPLRTGLGVPYMIEVYNKGRNETKPLLSLYDAEGVHTFFALVCAAPQVIRALFAEGEIALVAFSLYEEGFVLQMGYALYRLSEDDTLRVDLEQGALAGLFACLA